MEALNHTLFFMINGLNGVPFWDIVNILVAEGSPYVYAAVLAAFFVSGRQKTALHGAYSALAGLLANVTISFFYVHPRPFMEGIGRTLIAHAPETSFPSDHTTLAFAVAFSVLFSRARTTGTWLTVLAVLTGFSRIYTGVHFPFDIAGSVLAGLFPATLVAALGDRLNYLDDTLTRIYSMILYQFSEVLVKAWPSSFSGKHTRPLR